jgi:hypothetical protein
MSNDLTGEIRHAPLLPGHRALEFTLPAADREGPAELGKFPTDEELLPAVRALPG